MGDDIEKLGRRHKSLQFSLKLKIKEGSNAPDSTSATNDIMFDYSIDKLGKINAIDLPPHSQFFQTSSVRGDLIQTISDSKYAIETEQKNIVISEVRGLPKQKNSGVKVRFVCDMRGSMVKKGQ